LRAVRWLVSMQRPSGGWGGGALGAESIEETALSVLALTRYLKLNGRAGVLEAVRKGTVRLLQLTRNGTQFLPSPIGLYFARLWYFEKLYPIIWTVATLRELLTLDELS